MRTALLLLLTTLFFVGCAAPTSTPSASPSIAVASVAPETIENAGLAMVTMPPGYEELAGMNGRGSIGQLVLSGPFYGDRALIAVCDGGNGSIAYSPEGVAELETLLVCHGKYGASSRTLSLAAGYLVFAIDGDAAMRWHVAIAQAAVSPAP